MKVTDRLPGLLVLAVLVLGAGLLIAKFLSPSDDITVVSVVVPDLSPFAASGKTLFDENCIGCHGGNAAGSDKGPPLVHNIYNPGHHADGSFFVAAQRGARQHHWKFGNMPPQPQVTRDDIAAIVTYIRELQRANGIVTN